MAVRARLKLHHPDDLEQAGQLFLPLARAACADIIELWTYYVTCDGLDEVLVQIAGSDAADLATRDLLAIPAVVQRVSEGHRVFRVVAHGPSVSRSVMSRVLDPAKSATVRRAVRAHRRSA